MAFNVRHPLWISTVTTEKPGAYAFATLFFLECMARASLVTVISLQAYEILQDGQKVSFLYTALGLCTMIISFAIPLIIRLTARRYVYSLGALLILCSSMLLVSGEIFGQAAAMLCRTFGTSCLNVTLSLYIMDYIARQDLLKSEPMRLLYSTFAWVVAPFMGVFLWREFGMIATSLTCASMCLLLLGVFWYLRLNDTIKAAHSLPAANPFKNLHRFWSQPRLRLAWLLAFSRCTWWMTFFAYTPIYMVSAGESEYMAATVIVFGNMSLFVNMFTSRIASYLSIRKVLVIAFGVCGSLTFIVGFLHSYPFIAAAFFVGSAIFISFSDGLSTIPFMRSVHPYERESMTTVYRTFMDTAELLSPLAYGLFLFLVPFSYLFSLLGFWLLLTGLIVYIFLPRKL